MHWMSCYFQFIIIIPLASGAAVNTFFFLFQKKFPTDNLAEWNNGQPLGLRTVHAYVLVFDMGNLETFQVGSKKKINIMRGCRHSCNDNSSKVLHR